MSQAPETLSEEQLQRFYDALASKAFIAGWSHNPWVRQDSDEAFCQRMVETYIQRFCDDMEREYGVMPFTGAEINYQVASHEHSDPSGMLTKATSESARAYYTFANSEPMQVVDQAFGKIRKYRSKIEDLARARVPVYSDSLERIDNAADIQAFLEMLAGQADAATDEQLYELKQMIQEEKLPGSREYQLFKHRVHGFCDYCKNYKHQKNGRVFPYDPQSGLPLGIEYAENILGKIHVDEGDQPEIAQPPDSPINTITAVNALKQATYEASDEYTRLFLEVMGQTDATEQEQADWLALIPRSLTGHLIYSNAELPFNIRYGLDETETIEEDPNYTNNCAEHLSVSLLAGQPNTNCYEEVQQQLFNNDVGPSLPECKTHYKHNLTGDNMVAKAMKSMMNHVLPADVLLTIGNPLALSKAVYGKRKPFSIRLNNDGNRANSQRVELRSYIDSASDIGLAMLPMTAACYALCDSAGRVKPLREHLEGGGRITIDDIEQIRDRFNKDHAFREIGESVEEIVNVFNQKSIALKMMHHWVEKHYPDPCKEKEAALEDIERFRQIVIKRFLAMSPDEVDLPIPPPRPSPFVMVEQGVSQVVQAQLAGYGGTVSSTPTQGRGRGGVDEEELL